jgi:hypothetical protein
VKVGVEDAQEIFTAGEEDGEPFECKEGSLHTIATGYLPGYGQNSCLCCYSACHPCSRVGLEK